MANFTKWIDSKLQPHSRVELLEDLVPRVPTGSLCDVLLYALSEEQMAQVVDELATKLNEEGHDWNA
jgi:hypothetical protein